VRKISAEQKEPEWMLDHRLQCLEIFKNMKEVDQLNILIHIENSCANETIRKARGYNLRCVWENPSFINIYHTICYSITSILEQESNTLIGKILNNKINLKHIANMSCKELSPETHDAITFKINKRVNIEQNIKFTEMYFCKKCKHNKTTVERVQNRSGDEGSSFYITCLFCGTKWFK
jgi:DNA-directed RNA polymerase subunit M/transcription elongation factor TFIIS